MYLSTAVLVNIVYGEIWFGKVSLVVEMGNIIFMNALIHPFISFFNAPYFMRKI